MEDGIRTRSVHCLKANQHSTGPGSSINSPFLGVVFFCYSCSLVFVSRTSFFWPSTLMLVTLLPKQYDKDNIKVMYIVTLPAQRKTAVTPRYENDRGSSTLTTFSVRTR